MAGLPKPFSSTERYLAAILDKLGEIDQRIERMAADMQAKPELEPVETKVVELREPLGNWTDHPAASGVTDGRINTGEMVVAADEPVHYIGDDFPGASHLRAAGYELLETVPRDEKSLTAISGIGKATAAAILEKLGE